LKSYSRADRIGQQIVKILAELLQKETGDPRLAKATVTGVKMSPDLKSARIYFTCQGGEKIKEAVTAGFGSAKGFLKRTLAKELGLRYMPELKFFYDESFDYGERIDKVLKSINAANGIDHLTVEKK
jgi:ribosome-binding factor A